MKSNYRARLRRSLFAAGALATLIPAAGCGSKPVATVNGMPVTQEEFNERCVDYVAPQNGGSQTVGVAVLGNVITLKILESELRKLNKLPSEADVDRRVDTVRKQFAFMQQPLEEQLRRQGRSEAAFRRDMRDALIGEDYRLKDVTVTDAEAKQYYDRHPDSGDWSMDERIQISVIAVDNKADLDRAVAELKSNAKFNDVASAIPKGQWKQFSGPINHWFTKKDLQGGQNIPIPPQVIQKAFDLPMGQYSEPIRLGTDPKDPSKAVWFIVETDQKKKAQQMPFEDAKDLVIRAARFEKAQSKMQQMASDFRKVAQNAEIEVTRPEWQEIVKNFRQAVLGAGGQGTSP